jgi:Fuseless
MNPLLVNMLNCLFYEHLIATLVIFAWRGVYGYFDAYLYPDDQNLSAGLSLVIGYVLFFPLMYTQSLQNTVYIMPKFFQTNYPLLTEHLRHLGGFLSCVLLWRGFWIFFDLHIATVSLAKASPYLFYVVCMLIAFMILSIVRTASSINGAMSNINDPYDLFPLYTNCFLVKWFGEKKISSEVSSNRSDEAQIYQPYTITMF